jgi:hypothetical protein
VTKLIKMAGAASLIAELLFYCGAAHAGDIYRWVDDQGVTQMGDTVPPAYKSRAKVIGSTESSIDPQQQKDAQARAAEDAARLKQLEASKPSVPSTPQPAATPQPRSAGTDCASLFAAYRASQACYAPYVTVNGLKGNNNCTPLPDPSSQCGNPTASP